MVKAILNNKQGRAIKYRATSCNARLGLETTHTPYVTPRFVCWEKFMVKKWSHNDHELLPIRLISSPDTSTIFLNWV